MLAKWISTWEKSGVQFGSNKEDDKRPTFSMVMPPPNITGHLHLGHTLMIAIEDLLTRYKRMKGFNVCWVPGTDHAGIATQSVVERNLAKQGISKHELGRAQFIEKVWDWKNQKGQVILDQLRRLGSSCDWSRKAFTLSPALSKAVVKAFIELYNKKLIYRDKRLVFWSPYLNTALSDIEVDSLELSEPKKISIPGYSRQVEVGYLWTFYYAVENSEEKIPISTTRPETMLGDVAIAVNPTDKRYKHLVGRRLIHPFISNRKMIVVADNHCDVEFGTGAVKITPAHDKNDYEIACRHNLEIINIFTTDGKMNSNCGEFCGMHRFEARYMVEKRLTELGLFIEKTKNPKKMVVPICSRSGDIIEPLLIPQWYVNCKDMADRAIQAVKSSELKIYPASGEKQWNHWLSNIKDWCISRQLWWGHQIPAYRVTEFLKGNKQCDFENEQWVVAESFEEALKQAKKKYGENVVIERDSDVLDTWFSSGLFPFSVFGWPNETADLKKFFPTDILETGSDILFFWVARMVMLSLELTDKLPFHTILLHPIVRDAHGRKMSKSLGNIIDPVDVINGISLDKLIDNIKSGNVRESEMKQAIQAVKKEYPKGIMQCGSDALRFCLLSYLRAGKDINLDVNRIVGYRHFCNKIWQAAKFVLSIGKKQDFSLSNNEILIPLQKLRPFDKWILSHLMKLISTVEQSIEEFDFYSAVSSIYSFFLSKFCDVYIEYSKHSQKQSFPILFNVLEMFIRLSHPFLPFVTEEIWQSLYHDLNIASPFKLLISSDFPISNDQLKFDVEDEINLVIDALSGFRSFISKFEFTTTSELVSYIVGDSLMPYSEYIQKSVRLGDVIFVKQLPTNVINYITPAGKIIGIQYDANMDLLKVKVKSVKRQELLESLIKKIQDKMQSPQYSEKVPITVQESNSENLTNYKSEQKELEKTIEIINSFL